MDKVLNWYKIQLEAASFYRLGVMAFILLVQLCVLVPVTLLVISMNGGSAIAFGICTILSFLLLTLLLGDVPAKVTIPVFVASVLIQLLIIFGTIII